MSFFRKIYNTITCSKPWYYIWELKYKIAFRYIHWLLARNGITAPSGRDPLWHYLLGYLTSAAAASKDGIAVKELYIVQNRFFKIRGFSLISITKGEERIKAFCDINAREAYHILGGLIQLPIINASDWSPESQQEKNQLTRTLHDNSYELWLAIKKSCLHLSNTWHRDKHLPFNVGMQAFSILGTVLFSLKSLPDELFPLIERFEKIWGNPQHFSAQELRQNVDDFERISQSLHQQRDNRNSGDNDLLNKIFKHHQPRQFQITSPIAINIAAYFAFFENMSKAMIGLFAIVFSKERWLNLIISERHRLKQELKSKGLSSNSKEGFQYILNHSELFDRFYMEVLRFWTVAPVLPRINPNVFSNIVANDFVLPPRSLAIVPQYAISRSEAWSNPEQFNPMRSEYHFTRAEDQATRSIGIKPLVQGAEGSFRRCPAKEITRKYFYAMMWWFPKYNQLSLTKQERRDLKNSLAPDAFYRPLTTEETQQVFGNLKGKPRIQNRN